MVFWIFGVVLTGVVNFAWAINDLRTGSARMFWYGARINRTDEPFEFWLAVGSKFMAVPVCGAMLWFAYSTIFWKL